MLGWRSFQIGFLALGFWGCSRSVPPLTAVGLAEQPDHIRQLQTTAIQQGKADWGHWGSNPDKYTAWGNHSNRLIPIYTFGTRDAGPGVDLDSYIGKHSVYRRANDLKLIYNRLPEATLNPQAEYCDQTNIYDLQMAALKAGKKYIFLVVFDGMDWQTTRNASIHKLQKIAYTEGRGTGFHFQDYTANGTTQFGWMVTAPHNTGTNVDVDAQTVDNPGGKIFGGYSAELGGPNPWTPGSDINYLITANKTGPKHAYTDSSCSMSNMTGGIKSYNNAINVDFSGAPFTTIAHVAQEQGLTIAAVTSVPISHATPAATYAHNVDRDDFQDLTRDLLGLKSIMHPEIPLRGLDILIGGGFGDTKTSDIAQGRNYVPGNVYLTDADLKAVNVKNGGKYVVAVRTKGKSGKESLQAAAEEAAKNHQRLLGFYGVGKFKGHLPFATADGDYRPAPGRSTSKPAEAYTDADIRENPTLVEMATAALTIAAKNPKGFWMMVEAGDVDWANHDNNLDNSIGAVITGDAAVKTITDWVEANSNWKESLLIVTADHGHYFHLLKPERLIAPATK